MGFLNRFEKHCGGIGAKIGTASGTIGCALYASGVNAETAFLHSLFLGYASAITVSAYLAARGDDEYDNKMPASHQTSVEVDE